MVILRSLNVFLLIRSFLPLREATIEFFANFKHNFAPTHNLGSLWQQDERKNKDMKKELEEKYAMYYRIL